MSMRHMAIAVVAISLAARLGPAQTQTPETQPAAKPSDVVPSISGVWREPQNALVNITQVAGAWSAECSYIDVSAGEVRWRMLGTITPSGKIHGTLQHTKAPSEWQQTQVRGGVLSDDGDSIEWVALVGKNTVQFKWERQTGVEANQSIALPAAVPATQPMRSRATAAPQSVPKAPPIVGQREQGAHAEATDKKVVLTARQFRDLPRSHMGFTSFDVGSVGYLGTPNIELKLDESTAIVTVELYNRATGLPASFGVRPQFAPAPIPMIVEGMPTAGVVEDAGWRLESWFQIVGTREVDGRTHPVLWQIVQAGQRPAQQMKTR